MTALEGFAFQRLAISRKRRRGTRQAATHFRMDAPCLAPRPIKPATPPSRCMSDLPRSVANSLRDLADLTLQMRQDASTSSTPFDPLPSLAQAAPLFAYLQTANRDALLHAKACKDTASAARLEMDRAHLRLQVGLAVSRLNPSERHTLTLQSRISSLSRITWSRRFASARSTSASVHFSPPSCFPRFKA